MRAGHAAKTAVPDEPKATAGATSGNLMMRYYVRSGGASPANTWQVADALLPGVDHESIWNTQTSANCVFDKMKNCALSG